MKIGLFIVLFIVIGQIRAQDKIQVVDQVFNFPLESVSIKTDKRGAITDNEGFLDIEKIAPISSTDSISFSSIGYVSKKTTFYDIRANNYIVQLLPKMEAISEVTVIGEHLQESIKYAELSPMKMGVFAFGAEVVGDSIYIIGGDASIKDEYKLRYEYEHNSGKIQVYDISNDKWAILDMKLSNRAYHNIHYYDEKIYILGGKRLASNPRLEYLNEEVEVYDIKKNTVVSSTTNPHAAVNFASGLYEDNIIVMNGSVKQYEKRKKMSKQVHLFNLKTGYWYQLDDIPYRYETTGIVVDSILYQIGGFAGESLPFINAYNILTGVHHTERILPFKLEKPALSYNKYAHTIYIYEGGMLIIFNILTKMMYAYSINLNLKFSQIVYKNSFLYIIGGQTTYDVNTWIKIPSDKIYRIDINEFERTKKYLISRRL